MSDEQQGQQGQQAQQTGEPQWIAAPPPHPYAASQPRASSTIGKVLAIAAMALGLVSLLTVFISAVYFNPIVALAGVALSIVALVLGIIALVKKASPIGAAIVGVGTGALSALTVITLFGAGALLSTQIQTVEVAPLEQWNSDTAQESLLEWPANMNSGGIIFEGPGDPRPRTSEPLQPGTAPEPNQVNRESGNDILIYVDYRCGHCMAFEHVNNTYLTELIESGSASVEVVPLSFMDRASEGSYYSSRASGAVACFVDAQPDAAWAAHNALLTPQTQPGAGPGLSNDEILGVFDQAISEVSPAVRDCITTERFVPFAQGLTPWVFQNPVPNTVESNVRVEGTPLVVVNGAVYPGEPSDAEAFRAFVEEQIN